MLVAGKGEEMMFGGGEGRSSGCDFAPLSNVHFSFSSFRTIGGFGSVNIRFRTSAFSRPIDCALLSRHHARQVTVAPTTIPQKNQTRSSPMSKSPVIRAPYRSALAATSFLLEKYVSASMDTPTVKPT